MLIERVSAEFTGLGMEVNVVKKTLSRNNVPGGPRVSGLVHQLIDVFRRSGQYLPCHVDVKFVEARLFGLVAFGLGGQDEEIVADESRAHR
jgi:hypothetical protein